jgi:chorismate mutase
LLYDVAQEAMDLNFDGIIIESHMCPEKAWSDASQQLTPADLQSMLNKIVMRHANIGDTPRNELDELRKKIDKIDAKLLETFKERMAISEQIGKYKFENNITILQTRRYDEVMNDRKQKAVKYGLGEEFVIKMFETIHEESIHRQSIVMNKELAKKQ